jgi:integrase
MRIVSETKDRITKSVIEATWKRRAPGQRLIVRDGECRGLCLIVNPRTMVWSFAYRPPGKDPRTGRRWPNRPMVLGSPDGLTRDEAKQTVERLKVGRLDGRDPADARKAAKQAATRKQAHTLERLLADYEVALPQRPKMRGTAGKPGKAYVAGELRQVQLAIETIGQATPASDVTEAEIRKLLRGPAARNRFSALSRFFDWLVEEAIVAQNPCVQVPKSKRPRPYGTRSRHLQPAALAILWQAAAGLREPVWRDLVRFLIAIPCRRGEAARLDWSHLDLPGCVWSQPAALTKNGDPHRLRLHPLAVAVLESRRQAWAETEAPGDAARQAALLANGYPRLGRVFPAPKSGGEIMTFASIKRALVELTKTLDADGVPLSAWAWHDFRRSVASALGEAGIQEAVADAILNHRQAATRGGVLGVYQRSSRWPEQVKAMEFWGGLLAAALTGPRPDDNVIYLNRPVG